MRALGLPKRQNPFTAIFASIFICGVVVLIETGVAAQDISPSATPAQLAAAIAHTMTATSPAMSSSSPMTIQVSAHENVVERLSAFKDANVFANVIANREILRTQSIRYMCKPDRLVYIKRGVVFHDIYRGPDVAKSFEFFINERACASLASQPAVADAATLTKMAQDISGRLVTLISKEHENNGFRFDKVSASGSLIRVLYKVYVPAFVDYFKMRSFEVRGKTQGRFCVLFGDAIRQGVRIDVIYRLDDGSIALQFPVDNAVC